MRTPPATLDSAQVVEYAIVDDSVTYTGARHLHHDGTRVEQCAGLAICENPSVHGPLLFHCAEDWRVLGAQIWNAASSTAVRPVQEVKLLAESYYTGIGKRWVRRKP